MNFWKEYNLNEIHAKVPSTSIIWHTKYNEARKIIGEGKIEDIDQLCGNASKILNDIFTNGNEISTLRPLRLSKELENWKLERSIAGDSLPDKGFGLVEAPDEILEILGAKNWPQPLRTNNALYGGGLANFLIGAEDSSTLFSNYLSDMIFYYEHGYDRAFPSLEMLIEKALQDPHAINTTGGSQHREGARIGMRYIRTKINLERQYKFELNNLSARINRRMAQILYFADSSLLGMAAETIAKGYDPAGVMSDMVWSSPCTDVVDVGSDLINSEIMNSFLNVGDITDNGLISEELLRKIYDTYAAMGARTLTERWNEPTAKMCAALYPWHITNDRHMFLRRVILGWPKARKTPSLPQREADFDELFDENFRLTNFSRPLNSKYECDARDTCNRVNEFLDSDQISEKELLRKLWWYLVLGPLEYVRNGQIDENKEQMLVHGCRLSTIQLFSRGAISEMAWLIAHANHHAWQVNYLFEAAMFGSILDKGDLIGKLDRFD